MSERPVVFVLYRDFGSEGKSKPIAVTDDISVAEAWKLGGQNAIGGAHFVTLTLNFIPTQESA